MIDQYHWITVCASVLLVILAVILHYEVLARLQRFLNTTRLSERPRILTLIFVLLLAHIAEIWLFGAGALLMLKIPELGGIAGMPDPSLFETVYLSATTYSTLGYGDITPVGNIRFLYGTEALTGLVLITWSASLTFLELQRHWRDRTGPDQQA
jgi:hypothetical protein